MDTELAAYYTVQLEVAHWLYRKEGKVVVRVWIQCLACQRFSEEVRVELYYCWAGEKAGEDSCGRTCTWGRTLAHRMSMSWSIEWVLGGGWAQALVEDGEGQVSQCQSVIGDYDGV